jgi:hypothetical protein
MHCANSQAKSALTLSHQSLPDSSNAQQKVWVISGLQKLRFLQALFFMKLEMQKISFAKMAGC